MIAVSYDFDFRNFLVVAIVIAFVAVLVYRLLTRDERIHKTRFGFFMERERYEEEGETWTVDPLPPPTPPPPLPPRPDPDEATEAKWPQREEEP